MSHNKFIVDYYKKKYDLSTANYNDMFDIDDFSYHYSSRHRGIIIDSFINDRYTNVLDLIIPSFIDGKPVKAIGERCFSEAPYIERVCLPDTIEEIGDCAFWECDNLKQVLLPNSIQHIGSSVFSGSALECMILPEGIEEMPTNLFYGCRKIEVLILPESLEVLTSAFEYCDSIDKVICLGDIKHIKYLPSYSGTYSIFSEDNYVLQSCLCNNRYAKFGNINHLYNELLKGEPPKKAIMSSFSSEKWNNISTSLKHKFELNDDDFNDDFDLADFAYFYSAKYGGIVLSSFKNNNYTNVLDLRIPSIIDGKPVKVIGKRCFNYSRFIERVFIPNTVDIIEDSAFSECKNLYKIIMPEKLKELGNHAFSGSAIECMIIPEGIKLLGTNLFYGCEKLTTVFLPQSIERITSCFGYCTKLKELFVSDNVEFIDALPSDSRKLMWISPSNINYKSSLMSKGIAFLAAEDYYDKLPPVESYIDNTDVNNVIDDLSIVFSRNDILYIYKGQIRCHRNHHHIIPATAILRGRSDNEIRLNVEYCLHCKKFFLEYSLYELYRERYGIIIGNLRMITNGEFTGDYNLALESPLKLSGYSVGQKENLTIKERHFILARIIFDKIMSKGDVIKYLSYFIKMNGARKGNEIALKRWKADLQFIQEYNSDIQPKVYIDEIRKY